MSVFRKVLVTALSLLVAGCGGGSGGGSGSTTAPVASGPTLNPAQSLFTTAFPNGAITLDLDNATSDSRIDTQGDGYAMKVGYDQANEQFVAVSALVGGTRLEDAPITGTVTYSGVFEALRLDRTNGSDTTATLRSTEGTLDLSADFERRSFTGQSRATTGGNPVLAVTGAMTGNDMTGSVTFRSGATTLTGAMRGRIDADKSIGAFHANDDVDAMSGGFLLTAD